MKVLKHNEWEKIETELRALKYSERDIKLIKTCLIVGANLEIFDNNVFDFLQWNRENNHFFNLKESGFE